MFKRIFCLLLAMSLCLGMCPVTVFSAELPECICVVPCAEENRDFSCPVCGADDALLTDCALYTKTEALIPETTAEPETETEETAAVPTDSPEPMVVDTDESNLSTAGTIRSGTCGASGSNVSWLLETDGLLTISGTGAMKDYTSEKNVPWYNWAAKVLNVVVEDGVTYLGSYAFRNLENLTAVTMASSVTSIGKVCFGSCPQLTKVSLSDNLQTMGVSCFTGCSALTNIELPANLKTLGSNCFYSCSALTSITLPDSLTSLGQGCFQNCTRLASVQLSSGLTALPTNCFYGCSALTAITLPNSLISLGQHCFASCTGLTEITIPWSVSAMEYGCFQSCSNLSQITFLWDAPSLGSNVFNKVAPASTAYIPRQANWTYADLEKIRGNEDTWEENIWYVEYYNHKHQYEQTGKSTPTCTKPGCYTYKCFCGDSYDEVHTPATGHTEKVLVTGCPANCTTEGLTDSTICTVCGSTVAEQTVIPALGHTNKVTKAGYPATCTQDGLADETYCEVCQTYTSRQDVLPALGHREQRVPGYDAACEETGLTDGKICAVCKIVLTAHQEIPAKGHTRKELPKKDATCTETGLTRGEQCSVCETILTPQEVVPALGHQEKPLPYKAPTCTETGLTEGTQCTVCETILRSQEEIPATGHTEIQSRAPKEPTCTADGWTEELTCQVCHVVTKPWTEIPATGHPQIETIPGKEPTCTEYGLTEGIRCKVCGKILEEQLHTQPLGHTRSVYRDPVSADCTNPGMSAGIKCSVCDTVLQKPEQTPPLGHSYVNYRCSRCGQIDPDLPTGLKITESEPNNNEEHANVIGDGYSVSGKMDIDTTFDPFNFDPFDYFVFSVSEKSKVRILIESSRQLLISVKDGADQKYYTGLGSYGTISLELSEGTYYLDLSLGTKYYTSYSFSISITPTDPVPRVPATPYKITNVVSGIHVYWKSVSDAAKYGLWRSETGKDGTYEWIANPSVPHFTDTSVESGKTYWYKVTAISASGKSSDKSGAIGLTYVATPDITLRVNRAVGVGLTWQKIPGATGYAIYRKTYSGGDAWKRVATISGGDTLKWDDHGVRNENGKIYRYTVRALAGADRKTLSGCRNTGRTMVRITSLTLNSAVKAGSTSIKCKWSKNSEVTGYEVRFMVGSTVYRTWTIGNINTTSKTFTGLKSGQTYKIQVRSYKKVDGVGSFYSAWSTAKNVTLK